MIIGLCFGIVAGGGTIVDLHQRDIDRAQNAKIVQVEKGLSSLEYSLNPMHEKEVVFSVIEVEVNLDGLQSDIEKYGRNTPQVKELTISVTDSLKKLSTKVCTPELLKEADAMVKELDTEMAMNVAKQEDVPQAIPRIQLFLKKVLELCAPVSN